MTNSAATARPVTPWHLWLVGGVAALWNAFGSFDFTATVTRFEPYLSNFSQELKDYVYGSPPWMFLIWGVAAFAGFAGSLLILKRHKAAVPVLAISLAGAAASGMFGVIEPPPEQIRDPVFATVIVGIAAALLAYAMWMSRRGVLR